jgi:hypothetical protein
MRILESSVARLMFAVLTVAIGLVTLRSQSEFWLGVLYAVAASWGLVAVGALALARETRRRFWTGFLAAASAVLLLGFGPWSDARVRGSLPTNAKGSVAYRNEVLPSTRGLLMLSLYVRPWPRATVEMLDARGIVIRRIEMAAPDGRAGELEQFMIDLDRFVAEDIRFYSFRPGYATRYVVTGHSLAVYLDAAYVLVGLLIGTCAGSVTLLLDRLRPRRPIQNPGRRLVVTETSDVGST